MDPFNRVIEQYSKNTPDIHEFNRWLREVADEFEDRVLIGEINLPLEKLVRHYGAGDEFHLPFNFRLIDAAWDPKTIRALTEKYEGLLPPEAWPNWVLGNHDQHRVASRTGSAQARIAMMLLLTLRGTPTVYYGDEIGMEDGEIPPDRVQDPWEKYVPGIGLGRDPERTPMQWDATPHAGFCPPGAEPWLPVNDDYLERNVAAQRRNPASFLQMTQQLVGLRSQHAALHRGDFQALAVGEAAQDALLAYTRTGEEAEFLVILNFTDEEQVWETPAAWENGRILLSTHMDLEAETTLSPSLTLRANEGIICRRTTKT
jgi:alpha-glucosidase